MTYPTGRTKSVLLAAYLCLLAWANAQAPTFSNGESQGVVKYKKLEEASGLAASRRIPGYLYTHNDHGDTAKIYVLDATTGAKKGIITLKGATGVDVTANDYEDIAVGPCSATSTKTCVYVGDFGDGGKGPENIIYRFPEPKKMKKKRTIKISKANILKFSWNQPDCETLMIDPSANVYIVSKVKNGKGAIAQVPSENWGTGKAVDVSTNANVGISSDENDPVGGDISLNGLEVLLRTHHDIYYWAVPDPANIDYVTLLQTKGTIVSSKNEPQGESVAWDENGLGYYTLSEGLKQDLYYFARTSK